MPPFKKALLYLQAIFYVVAGLNHFINPDFYTPMMPAILPVPEMLHKFSGVLEIIGGVGLLFPRFQSKAAWLVVLILVLVYPANVHVALENGAPMGISPTVAWLRLPFQFILILWAWWYTLPSNRRSEFSTNK